MYKCICILQTALIFKLLTKHIKTFKGGYYTDKHPGIMTLKFHNRRFIAIQYREGKGIHLLNALHFIKLY